MNVKQHEVTREGFTLRKFYEEHVNSDGEVVRVAIVAKIECDGKEVGTQTIASFASSDVIPDFVIDLFADFAAGRISLHDLRSQTQSLPTNRKDAILSVLRSDDDLCPYCHHEMLRSQEHERDSSNDRYICQCGFSFSEMETWSIE